MSTGRTLGEVIQGHMYRGAVSGLNEAFVIDQTLHDRLMQEDPKCAAIMKPMLRGEDLRPWYQENEGLWLIFARRGIDMSGYSSVLAHLEQFRDRLEPRPKDRNNQQPSLGRKPGNYKWYELQDTAEYYELLDKPKIFWPSIGKFPRFSWDEQGQFVNSKGYILLPTDISLLGILQSRVIWYCIVKYCQPLGERAGLVRYQQNSDKMCDLPIPHLNGEQRGYFGKLAQELTTIARQRYEVRRKTTYRISHDLGTPQAKLNQKLETWWELPFKEFRDELVKVFKRDIPLRERDDWEVLLRERASEIARLTSEIVRLETELNAVVYNVFGLGMEERNIIERETKYQYGEW